MASGDGHGSQEAKPVMEDPGEGKVELDCSGESKAGSKYSDDSEVFEEAIDDIQMQQDQWQSGPTEDEHVICAVDNGDGGGIVHEENLEPNLAHETEKINQEHEKFNEAEDVLAEGQVFSDRKGGPWEVSDSVQEEEDGKEAELRCTNDKEVEGVADGGVVIEECTSLPVNGETTKSEIEIGEKEESTDFGANSAPIDIQENGDTAEAFADVWDVLAEGQEVSDRKGGPWEVSDSVQEEEDGKEAELRCTNDKEVEGVADGGVVIEECTSLPVNGETTKSEIEVGEKEESTDFGANSAPIDIQENGDFAEAFADARDAPEMNGLISSHSETHQTQDAITEKVASFDEETEGLNGGHADSSQTIAEKGDAVRTGACESRVETSEASEAKPQFLAGGEEQKQKEERGILHSSQVKEEVKQYKVTVEDADESSSSGEDENGPSVQPPLSTTSSFKKSSGPSLPSQPAGLGSSAPLLEPASRSFQPTRINGSTPLRQSQILDDPANGDAEENDETREKLQMIRVKFLRLAHRLGQTPHNVVVAQVLYRLGLAEQLRGSRNTNRAGAFSFDRASAMAEQLEASGQEPLDFSCTIMVIGKTGVGKSATINSIFDEVKFITNAFQPGTKKVQDIVGTVQGIKVRVIDTPGLSPSSSDQRKNEKILHSVKRFIKKSPPDIVLYLDRLDMQSRDYGDVPLLRTITDIFGTSIWFNAIVVLTHAASAPPDGMNGIPLSYEMFVTQRSHVVQQAIRQAAGDMRLMNPVSLVENHSACRMNRAGQRVLPNGQVWKPQLLLLSFASKILAEANELLKLQDSPPGKPFGARTRVPPLPFLLSSLLQSRPQLKLPEEQIGDDDSMEEDLDSASDSGDESDYDELPPFKCLTRAQIAKLSRAQKKAYYEEVDYREKLFYKKQLKEEKKRRKLLKKMAEAAKDVPDDYNNENLEDESSGPASVPVPMADLVLPASFDSDYPSHRYRFLDSSSPWIVRPVLETQGWDHDVGYEGLNVERMFVVKEKVPISVSGQLTKDKKECTLQMEMASSIKHGEGKATSLGLDMQTVGKDMAYTLRGETRFNNFRCNNTAAGVSVTLLGDSLSAGLKIEDKLILNKRLRIVMNGGAMAGRGDIAYGGRLEAILRDKDYPLVRTFTTLALSVVDWHGDLAIGCNLQSQVPIGRHTNLIGHANLNNRGTGQVGIRINSSEHLQLALVALWPVLRNIQRMFSGSLQST